MLEKPHKRPVPKFNLKKIALLSILDEPAVGINTPKREMSTSPHETSKKPSKCMRKDGKNCINSDIESKGMDGGDEIDKDVKDLRNEMGEAEKPHVLSKNKKGGKKKKSPRLKIAARFGKGNVSAQRRMHRAQVGQSLISDYFDKAESKGVNVTLDFGKDTSAI